MAVLGLVDFKMVRDWEGHRDYEAVYLVQDFTDLSLLPPPGSHLSLASHQDVQALHLVTIEAKRASEHPHYVLVTALYSTRDPMIRGIVRMWDVCDVYL